MEDSYMETAWAAGLFEGEGCISHYSHEKPYAKLALAMVDEDVVRRFHAIVGVGHVNYRFAPAMRKAGRQPQWVWATGNQEHVRHVLALFAPYFGERRAQRAAAVTA